MGLCNYCLRRSQRILPCLYREVKNRLHIGFDDPADAVGNEEEVLAEYRRVRDEIQEDSMIFIGKFEMSHLEILVRIS